MCARGSSDHAAVYGRYLIEAMTGTPVSHAAPAAITLLDKPATVGEGVLCLAISQSGRSPDLLGVVDERRAAGATVVALVNDSTSPLAARADVVVPLSAGPERSVAATKSFIASLAALALLAAAWTRNEALRAALDRLPAALGEARDADWSDALPLLAGATNLFTIGRGASLGVAREAALKLKETCRLHAEAFSSAEVRHGPMAIVGEGFPVLAFADSTPAGVDVATTAAALMGMGARTAIVGRPAEGAARLPLPDAAHAALEPVLMAQALYPMVDALARLRGLDVDRPPHLNKVTCTL